MSAGGARLRVAVNPIPYWVRDGVVDKSREVFEEAFADYRDIGITAVKADLPEGMTADEYRAWIGSFGLAPAISTFMAPFDPETGALDADGADRTRRFAADQVELGNTATMIIAPMTQARMDAPTRAIDDSPARWDATRSGVAAVADAMRAEGLFPGIHQHVGTLVESEAETRRTLDELGRDAIGFAPDSGHLAWAGADPVALATEYADRIVGVHVKDVFSDHLDSPDPSLDYHEIGATKRLWAEPGLGVVDLAGFLAALPDDFAGDVMIEVDVPSVPSRAESARMSHEWALAHLPGAR